MKVSRVCSANYRHISHMGNPKVFDIRVLQFHLSAVSMLKKIQNVMVRTEGQLTQNKEYSK